MSGKELSKNMKIALGVLLGILISGIFFKAINDRNCIVYKSPNPLEIKDKIHTVDKKCYKYEQIKTECTDNPVSNNIVDDKNMSDYDKFENKILHNFESGKDELKKSEILEKTQNM